MQRASGNGPLARPSRRLLSLFCVFAIPIATQAQFPIPDTAPQFRNAWDELPEWLNTGLPFDAQAYFAIDPVENREPLYLAAFVEFDYSLAPQFYAETWEGPENQARRDETRLRRQRVVACLDALGNRANTSSLIVDENKEQLREVLREVMAPFKIGLQRLEEAQKRPRCFFHPEVDSSSAPLHLYIGRQIGDVLTIRALLDLGSDQPCRNARIGLQLKRDLIPLADQLTQHINVQFEEVVLKRTVRPLLEKPDLSDDHLRELTSLLKKHYLENRSIDPAIQAERYEYLMLRNLLHQLQTGQYAEEAAERSESIGFDRELSVPELLLRELTALGSYEVNSDYMESYLRELAVEDSRMQRALDILNQGKRLEDKLDPLERMSLSAKIQEAGLAPILLSQLPGMTAEDYDTEVQMLNRRYQQIEAACQKPYPDAYFDLRILDHAWTIDDSWKNGKLLKWFQLNRLVSLSRCRTTIQTGAYLCLTAAKQWQRKYRELPTQNMAAAMAEIGVDHVPIDPFSGESLKFRQDGADLIIYSVGPDQRDDNAELFFNLFDSPRNNPDKDPGDVVYRFRIGSDPTTSQ